MKIGIIVGRFQLPELHEGHQCLLAQTQDENDKVIMVIGKSPVLTNKNPLPIEYIKQHFIGMQVLEIPDMKYDNEWVNALDLIISNNVSPDDDVTMYGGRDSFLKVYDGKFRTKEIECPHPVSATLIRENIQKKSITKNIAEGLIHSYKYRFPVAYPTVDIAIVDEYKQEVLMAKKENEKGYRFMGGFVDPSDISLEAAAARELKEETSIIADGNLAYIGSIKINDWRYAGTQDGIITSFFKCNISKNEYSPVAQDDIISLEWLKIDEITEDMIEFEHRQLFNILKEKTL